MLGAAFLVTVHCLKANEVLKRSHSEMAKNISIVWNTELHKPPLNQVTQKNKPFHPDS